MGWVKGAERRSCFPFPLFRRPPFAGRALRRQLRGQRGRLRSVFSPGWAEYCGLRAAIWGKNPHGGQPGEGGQTLGAL